MHSLYHPVNIGSLTIPGNIFLAPMAGYTDRAFRQVCLASGADIAFTEMISCEGLVYDQQKTFDLAARAEGEENLAVQLFTGDPVSAGLAAKKILSVRPALIDLNCGCPAPKVVKNNAGAWLMQHPERIAKIVVTLVDICSKHDLPVTVKLRTGWQAGDDTYLEAAEYAVNAGASLITLHPRYRSQGFSGQADIDHIRQLKKAVNVPVIGSGDLMCPEQAKKMIVEAECDGVMFARGAVGNPFIFKQTKDLFTGNTNIIEPDIHKRLETAFFQLRMSVKYFGEAVGCKIMRKQFCAYTKGIPWGAELRDKLLKCASLNEYRNQINRFLIEQELSTLPGS